MDVNGSIIFTTNAHTSRLHMSVIMSYFPEGEESDVSSYLTVHQLKVEVGKNGFV